MSCVQSRIFCSVCVSALTLGTVNAIGTNRIALIRMAFVMIRFLICEASCAFSRASALGPMDVSCGPVGPRDRVGAGASGGGLFSGVGGVIDRRVPEEASVRVVVENRLLLTTCTGSVAAVVAEAGTAPGLVFNAASPVPDPSDTAA